MPCDWAGLDVTAYVGADDGRDRRTRRSIEHRAPVHASASARSTTATTCASSPESLRPCARSLAELVRDLGEPFGTAVAAPRRRARAEARRPASSPRCSAHIESAASTPGSQRDRHGARRTASSLLARPGRAHAAAAGSLADGRRAAELCAHRGARCERQRLRRARCEAVSMSRAGRRRASSGAQARALKMPGLARAFEALARQAREERWSYEELSPRGARRRADLARRTRPSASACARRASPRRRRSTASTSAPPTASRQRGRLSSSLAASGSDGPKRAPRRPDRHRERRILPSPSASRPRASAITCLSRAPPISSARSSKRATHASSRVLQRRLERRRPARPRRARLRPLRPRRRRAALQSRSPSATSAAA